MTASLYGGTVTLTVEVAFTTTDPKTASPTWTDISAYVRSVTTRRGRWDERSVRCDAGTATIVLKNADRRFDPLYSAGAYFGNLLPMKQIRVRAAYNAVTYDLFRGYVDDWPQGWDPKAPKYSEVTISCTDLFGLLSTTRLPTRYDIEVLTDDPVGYWTMGDEGNEITDATVNANDGAWSGNTQRDASGVPTSDDGGRLMLGYVSQGDDFVPQLASGAIYGTGSLPVTTDDVTVEMWAYFGSASAGWVDVGALSSGASLGFYYGVVANQLAVYARSKDLTDEQIVVINIPTQEFVHLVATYDFSSLEITVFVNGVRQVPPFYEAGSYSKGDGIEIVNPAVYVNDIAEAFVIDSLSVYDSELSDARIVAHYLAGKLGGALDRTGARIDAVLDYVGLPSGLVSLDDGDSWLAAGPLSPSGALDYLYAIQETEQGRLFVSGAGVLTFKQRTWDIKTAAANTSQGSFGDSGAELPYQAITLDGGHVERITNEVLVTPQDGLPARAVDVTSQGKYGTRSESLSSLHPDQSGARNLAKWRLDRFSEPTLNFTELEVHPRKSAASLFPLTLGLELGTRITVSRRPQGVGSAISQDRTIEGVEHVITPDDCLTRWYLAEPTPNFTAGNWWRVGNASNGKVGTAVVPY